MTENNNQKDIYYKNLAVQAQAGDESSYRELLLGLAEKMRPFLYNHIFNKDMVEDVLQDTLVAVHQALHTYNPKYSFLSWSFAICRYKLIDYIRKYQKISENEINNDEYIATFVDESTNIEDEGLDEKLQSAIDSLPERQRQVVIMLKVNDYSIKEVANELSLSVANVKTIAHRAYKALRVYLEG
tara:strand:+ start:2744 stop:3298 length:555 start_codon:yes stop_codon:yes gene_type:complete